MDEMPLRFEASAAARVSPGGVQSAVAFTWRDVCLR